MELLFLIVQGLVVENGKLHAILQSGRIRSNGLIFTTSTNQEALYTRSCTASSKKGLIATQYENSMQLALTSYNEDDDNGASPGECKYVLTVMIVCRL